MNILQTTSQPSKPLGNAWKKDITSARQLLARSTFNAFSRGETGNGYVFSFTSELKLNTLGVVFAADAESAYSQVRNLRGFTEPRDINPHHNLLALKSEQSIEQMLDVINDMSYPLPIINHKESVTVH